ncbi:BatD family protein [Niabella sp. CC-SYL272]|uniref:BatD family protein n=1 Tax=Niabella agricola TaxID=2891571 RepID=UPI001F2ABACF|nr:BatD family protein [Niabella agricola]MCF3107248.1 BatD family protein [Niabella agricola]
MCKKGAWIIGVLYLLTVVLPASLYAQGPSVTASVDKNKILLGEPVLLTLEIRGSANSKVQPLKLDSIPHFEFLSKDSTVKEAQGGQQIIRQYFRITSFDSGRWAIPPIVLSPEAKTASILMDVVFTDPFDPSQPYHDIQDIRSVPFKLGKQFEKWWYMIALLLIMITLIIYWMTGEKKPRVETKVYRSAYARAKHQLEALKTSGVPESRFYARLVEILRAFLSERARVNSLQQTSGDLVEKIKPLFADEQLYRSLAQVLSLCDLVKFAKYDPEDTEAQSAYEVINKGIDHIEEGIRNAAKTKKEAHPHPVKGAGETTDKK